MTKQAAAEHLLRRHNLLVCVGPGGVGKTTIAASLGLVAARLGLRTLVLTIDPARRLADALCLEALADAPQRVPLPHADARARTTAHRGELFAAMLETGPSFDALIGRIAGSDDARDRILGNAIYKVFSRTLARSHAYVAMERLHHVTTSGDYDLVLLDTPPLRSALEIFDAPARLVHFLDESVLGHFLRIRDVGGHGGSAPRTGATAMRLLSMVTGRGLARELSTFLDAFLALREGFIARARETQAILRAPSTGFVLVTAPERTSVADAKFLARGLAERSVPLAALVVNRAFVAAGASDRAVAGTSDWEIEPTAEALGASPDLLRVVHRHRARVAEENVRKREAVEPLFGHLDASTLRFSVRALEGDIETRDELETLFGGVQS